MRVAVVQADGNARRSSGSDKTGRFKPPPAEHSGWQAHPESATGRRQILGRPHWDPTADGHPLAVVAEEPALSVLGLLPARDMLVR